MRMENKSHRSAHLLHSQQMKDMKKDVGTYMELEDAVAAIVEKDRLIAQLREHLREEAELKDEDDGTRSPRGFNEVTSRARKTSLICELF